MLKWRLLKYGNEYNWHGMLYSSNSIQRQSKFFRAINVTSLIISIKTQHFNDASSEFKEIVICENKEMLNRMRKVVRGVIEEAISLNGKQTSALLALLFI